MGIDLNSKPVPPMLPQLLRRRRLDEFRQIDLCTINGLSSHQSISPMRATLSRRACLRAQQTKLYHLGIRTFF